MKIAYLDNNTSAKPTETVFKGMLPFLKDEFVSHLSPYAIAQDQLTHCNNAFKSIKKLLGAKDEDNVLFCSSGAIAQNHVIFSTYFDVTRTSGKNHFLSSKVDEAPSIMAMHKLEKLGVLVKLINPSPNGHITKKEVQEALSPRTALLSITLASGLTGVLCDTYEISKICKDRSVLLHLDVTHVIGKMTIDPEELGADFISFNGEQLHAPKGTGALWVKSPRELSPFIAGEHLNVSGLVALGIAAEEAFNRLDFMGLEVARLRDFFERRIQEEVAETHVLFKDSLRTPNCSCIAFENVLSEPLLYLLSKNGVFASFGGGNFQKLSNLLKSCGIEPMIANSALSFSLAYDTKEENLEFAIQKINQYVHYLRQLKGSL
jgi:cysteine desulfurase